MTERGLATGLLSILFWFLASLGSSPPCIAESPLPETERGRFAPDGIHVLDGSCVLDVGELRVNITNHGLIGSQYSSGQIYSHAPSGEWPAGSGNEFLWGAGLWFGGRVGGEIGVSTGQVEREFRPSNRLSDTIYEARGGIVVRPHLNEVITGSRKPAFQSDDDGDGSDDEDYLNGIDDDGDGLVDEDFGQLGDQMFTCTMFDNQRLAQELYPEHRPLGLKVVQDAFSWDRGPQENIVILDYEISNVGHQSITDAYVGFFVDCDIQRRSDGSNRPDDLAGSFYGVVRGEDDRFYRAELAYMWDGAANNPVPGYFAVQLVDHTTAFDGYSAPFRTHINSFQIFSTQASVHQEGEPLSDTDRYSVMARTHRDRNTYADEAADLKVLISSGPFLELEIGSSIDYRIALLAGHDLGELLDLAAKAGQLFAGAYFDMDGNYWTGQMGRETKVCLGDYPPPPLAFDPIIGHRYDLMNDSCTGGYPVMFYGVIAREFLEEDRDGRYCVWVNMDNCEECLRYTGHECDDTMFWAFRDPHHPFYYPDLFTGTLGRETHFPWIGEGEMPPLAPRFRVAAGDRQVELFWDDRSEIVPDPHIGVRDFESYRIWRADQWTRPPGIREEAGPPARSWGLLAEYDLINEVPAGIGISPHALPLGENTGLEPIRYEPACVTDSRYSGLAEAMQQVVASDPRGEWFVRPPVRSRDGSVIPGMEAVVRWETSPAVLDTFFEITAREADPAQNVIAKRATRYYHFVDRELPNGFQNYYSIVAKDHQMVWNETEFVIAGHGIEEDPGNNFQMATPRPEAQTPTERIVEGNNIYVYPNPATRESLAEYLPQEPSNTNPTGVRVTFNNLPRARNTIRIFTVAGDLVQTLHHNGFTEGGATSWNLISRNKQEIVSGIYLYSVHSDGGGFEPFRGKFVVVR